jgi:hypothetical protein
MMTFIAGFSLGFICCAVLVAGAAFIFAAKSSQGKQ